MPRIIVRRAPLPPKPPETFGMLEEGALFYFKRNADDWPNNLWLKVGTRMVVGVSRARPDYTKQRAINTDRLVVVRVNREIPYSQLSIGEFFITGMAGQYYLGESTIFRKENEREAVVTVSPSGFNVGATTVIAPDTIVRRY